MAQNETLLESLLVRATAAISTGELPLALRLADAAKRRAPDSVEVRQLLAGVHRLCGHPEQAVHELEQARSLRQTAEIEAALVEALTEAGRLKQAAAHLDAALRIFPVEPGARLAEVARRLILADDAAPGWVGVSPELEIHGEFLVDPAGGQSELYCPRAALAELGVVGDEADGRLRRFWAPRQRPLEGGLDLRLGRIALLGAGGAYPPAFEFDGRCWLNGTQVRGWISTACPLTPNVKVVISDGERWSLSAAAEADPAQAGRWIFSVDLRGRSLKGGQLDVAVLGPDGRRQPFPDSPVITVAQPPRRPRLGPLRRTIGRLRGPVSRQPVDVIVPVFLGLNETLDCIASLQRTLHREAEIVVIDDASPDPDLALALDRLAERGAITLLRNRRNLGFPASVNRGLRLHRDRDVVILNSDAQVFPGWLTALKRAAYASDRVGTVTPLTNCGSIASYPATTRDCSAEEAALIARTIGRLNPGVSVDVPTGVGFCMFIRRDCLSEVGELDAAAFGKGYGEENDFCLRAAQQGWRHVIATDVFVRHLGSRSFGTRKQALLERNLRILNARYPHYEQAVAGFEDADRLRLVRRAIDEALVKACPAPAVLLVSLDLSGGVERLVRQRAAKLQADGFDVFVLQPAPVRFEVRLSLFGSQRFEHLAYRSPDEKEALMGLLKALPLEFIELHHFLNHDPDWIEQILDLGFPYEVYAHDYSWICPRITLIGGDHRYCGEPRVRDCEACLKSHGGRLEPGLTVRDLRLRSQRWINRARRVVVPSQDAAVRLGGYFRAAQIEVDPWEVDDAAPAQAPDPGPGEMLKVALVGAIGEHKGYDVLLACAQDAAARDLPIEFVVIGFTRDDQPLWDTGKVFITGEYAEGEAAGLIAREAPHIGFFPSVWPETWCFALSEALRAGLPVLAFGLGAIAERLHAGNPAHRLLPLVTNAPDINDCLLTMGPTADRNPSPPLEPASDFSSDAARLTAPEPQPVASLSSTEAATLFATVGTSMQDAKSGLTVSAEVLSLNKGIYQFAVQAAAPRRVGEDGDLVLPAIHVGPGPGIAPEAVEMMTGMRNDSAWLYEPRDTLIVKIKSSPTPILVTSVRSEGMAPLEIAVERIDVKKPPQLAPTPALPALAAPPSRVAEAAALAQAAATRDPAGRLAIRTQILAHIQNKGDVSFVDTFWAGALGEGLPIEAFSVAPLEGVPVGEIEYKGLTSSGVETPWTSGGLACGTRGMQMPLIGFAVRLVGAAAEQYDCEYRGAFRSGRIVGPIANGAPCRAVAADDHLEGIQLNIVQRRKAIKFASPPELEPSAPAREPAKARKIGPKFSVFREEVE